MGTKYIPPQNLSILKVTGEPFFEIQKLKQKFEIGQTWLKKRKHGKRLGSEARNQVASVCNPSMEISSSKDWKKRKISLKSFLK